MYHMTELDPETIMYPRNYQPFGTPWEKWAAIWCNWLLSIPRDKNPAVDESGENSSQNQVDANVWFLAGSFGNNIPVRRKCTVPKSKAILFPIVDKEDSFAEDVDLIYEEELAIRAIKSMDRLISQQLIVDGNRLTNLSEYRVLSEFFDLKFPKNNVYDVNFGTTRAVCDGYWAFLRPLPVGPHEIYFSAEIFLPKDDEVTKQIKNCPVYRSVAEEIDKSSRFKIEVTYELTVK
jgi:hypothetical protein